MAPYIRLGGVVDLLSGGARPTIIGLKNYGLKVLWRLVGRGLDINPPSSRSMAFAFLDDLRGDAGAAQKTAAEAFAFTRRLSDWPEGLLGGAAPLLLPAPCRGWAP